MATKTKKIRDKTNECSASPPRKKHKPNENADESELLTLKVPANITAAIRASTDALTAPLVSLIAEYSFGYDDAIELEFGGDSLKYNKLIGLEADDDEGCYRFLKKHRATLAGMYPQFDYRKHGIFKQIWNDLPYILMQQDFDFYGADLQQQFQSIIQKVSKTKRLNEKQQEEVDQVWKYVKPYYEYACTATDCYTGAPYRCIWLPVGGILWNDAQHKANENGLQGFDEIWEFMCNRGKNNCISQCGFYDTASRESFC